MPSPFVVREYDDPLKLVFEYQGCWFDTIGGSGYVSTPLLLPLSSLLC